MPGASPIPTSPIPGRYQHEAPPRSLGLRFVDQHIRESSLDELSEMAIQAQNFELWSTIASMRRRVLESSGSDEGTTRFRKKETLTCPPLSSATQYGPWRKAWVTLTEELKGFHLVWHFISRKVRTEYGHLPDAQMLASGSALLSRLLGPEEDMSTSQLQLLDDLERVVAPQASNFGGVLAFRYKVFWVSKKNIVHIFLK
jgi:hypothetical protein